MSEPPPSPLEINALRPRNDQKSYRPWSPWLGSHVARENSSGVRAKEPGAHGLPRSSRQTSIPASARRYVITDPPKPEPTTTASKASSGAKLVTRPATHAGSLTRDHAARCRVLGRIHRRTMDTPCVLASLGARDPGNGQLTGHVTTQPPSAPARRRRGRARSASEVPASRTSTRAASRLSSERGRAG